MDYKLLFDTAVMAGELLIKNGAETYRVEDTMYRILNKADLQTVEVLVMMTGFVATLDDPSIDAYTVVKRIESRETNLEKIDRINVISREFCNDKISLEETFQRIKEVKKTKNPIPLHCLMIMAINSGFAIMFGAHFAEVMIAALTGMMSYAVLELCKRFHLHMFLENMLCCVAVAVTVGLITSVDIGRFNADLLIISCIMPFVPGAAITNGIFDTLHGDYISGTARMAEAFVIAAAVAGGIGLGMVLI